MIKSINSVLILLIFLTACKKQEPDFSFEAIVDSTFFCKATINGETLIFPYHNRPTFGTEIFGDSILIKAYLNFSESEDPYDNFLVITIIKKYRISDLTFTINEYGIPKNTGEISNEEFQSMFYEGNYRYSYTDCSEECNKREGVELLVHDFKGTTYKTELLHKFVDIENSIFFYENAGFTVTKTERLSKDVITLEGEFNVEIYSSYGDIVSLNNGYFKAYCNNILYPLAVDKNLLWNK